ncbi:Hypothetical predicted protein [Octopus vulgaris]|uniref:Uncharacterized protein n=1 Tax=Octopus vulgaris TaxID=6645 RepID=A0AA36BE35_OCTVU|nr:Hypothetical predicted protein [Octopus vulgaris]
MYVHTHTHTSKYIHTYKNKHFSSQMRSLHQKKWKSFKKQRTKYCFGKDSPGVRKAIKRKNKSVDKTPPSTKEFERFSIHKNKNKKDGEDSKSAQYPFKKARKKSVIKREISKTFLQDCPKAKYLKYSNYT